jgi:hypothetical protein
MKCLKNKHKTGNSIKLSLLIYVCVHYNNIYILIHLALFLHGTSLQANTSELISCMLTAENNQLNKH